MWHCFPPDLRTSLYIMKCNYCILNEIIYFTTLDVKSHDNSYHLIDETMNFKINLITYNRKKTIQHI